MRYACARADRVASVAVFLATLPLGAERECRPARPLHVLVVAGTADPVVRWTGEVALGGFGTLQRRMSVPETFDFWRRANRCGGELAPARALPRRGRSGPDVLVHAASGCAGGVSTCCTKSAAAAIDCRRATTGPCCGCSAAPRPTWTPARCCSASCSKPGGVPGPGQEARRRSPARARARRSQAAIRARTRHAWLLGCPPGCMLPIAGWPTWKLAEDRAGCYM